MAKFRKINERDVLYGRQIDMWLSGLLGAIITTLPVFILMPIWFMICNRYILEDANGKVDESACFGINLMAGIFIWIAVAISYQLS